MTDQTVPDATLLDALDAEYALKFEQWCEAMGVEVTPGSLHDFLTAVNGEDASLPVEAQPHPFLGEQPETNVLEGA